MTTIIIMKFKVAEGREKEFEAFVGERAEKLRKQKGLQTLYLLVPAQASEYRLVSWWDAVPDHEAWVRKESYELSHNPKHEGLVVGTVPFEVATVIKKW